MSDGYKLTLKKNKKTKQYIQTNDIAHVVLPRLECQVTAQPQPAITWHVNGTQILPSQKYVISRDGSKSILEVRNLVAEDTGVYTCKAVTDIGEALSNTTLYVVGKSSQLMQHHSLTIQSSTVGSGDIGYHCSI